MTKQSTQTPRKKTSFNYGLKGWLLIFYAALAWLFIGGGWWNGTAQNTMVGIKAGQIGIENSDILALNSVIGYVSVFIILFVGILYGKYKTRKVQTIILIVGGIAVCFYGAVSTVATYCVVFLMVDVMANAVSSVGLPQMVIQWFPTKKGSALGWATIGINLAALVTLTVFNYLIGRHGIQVTTTMFGIATIIMGVINWFFIHDDPRSVGFEPDNGDFTPEEMEKHNKLMNGPWHWTNKEALRNKNFWLIGLAYGVNYMASTGFLSQMVPYQISMGMDAASAAKIMMLVPILAIPGSIVSGWIDQKFGTRRCGMMMSAFYVVASICGGFLPYNKVTNFIFILFFFWWTGATGNLPMSHANSTFGARDYAHVYGRMAFIINILRVTAPIILSVALNHFGGYRFAYKVFCVCSAAALVMLWFSDNRVDKEPGQAPTASYKV